MFVLALVPMLVSARPPTLQAASRFPSYQGQWVIINYWASWCGYCMEEVPELNAFYQRHKNKVQLFAVNQEALTTDELIEVIRASGLQYPSFSSDPKRYFRFRMRPLVGLPTTLVITPNGRLKRVFERAVTRKDLEKIIS